jgi:hypothetical protein
MTLRDFFTVCADPYEVENIQILDKAGKVIARIGYMGEDEVEDENDLATLEEFKKYADNKISFVNMSDRIVAVWA